MFAHNKRLQYTVRVSEPNPGLGTPTLADGMTVQPGAARFGGGAHFGA